MSGMCTFNISDGFSESIIRGFRKGLLGEQQYSLLKSVSSLKEFVAILAETDYMDYLQNVKIDNTTTLKRRLKRKLAKEINYVQSNCGETAQKFIQIIRHKYMLENVISVIEGKKNKTPKEVIQSRMEPLGYLKEISRLVELDITKVDELYDEILIDTEVGFYFGKLFEKVIFEAENKNIGAIQDYLNEISVEDFKNYLRKIWLEHFYEFTQTCDETTKEMMQELLFVEADFQAIQIIYNYLKGDNSKEQKEEKSKLLPNFGYLYPTLTDELIECSSIEQLRSIVNNFPIYERVLRDVDDPCKVSDFNLQGGLKLLDDYMFEEMAKLYSLGFEQQFQLACFYSYIKLNEQEVKNLVFLGELTGRSGNQASQLKNDYVVPFNY